MLAKTVNHGVMLFDGSLISGTIDTPVQRLREILGYARRNDSTVLAFSKATTLRANGILITEQLPNHDPPYLLETTGVHFKPPIMLLGDVYVARLNKANFAFRLDIDKETPVRAENGCHAEIDRQRPLQAKLPRNPAALTYPLHLHRQRSLSHQTLHHPQTRHTNDQSPRHAPAAFRSVRLRGKSTHETLQKRRQHPANHQFPN